MEENSEQKMLLCSNLYNSCENNQIKNYFNLNHNIKTINRIGPYGNTTLRIATFYGYNKVLQVLLTNTAFKSLQNNLSNTTLYDESRIDEIKKLFQKQSNLFASHEDIQDYDYIEWSVNDANLIQKRKDFREQIDLYKTYDNQHHLITKLLMEIIEYYINEYLIQQEHFSRDEIKKIEFYFRQAIKEQNYLKYFIKAYTLTNNFRRVLNKHLELYILDYFDISSYSSSTKYRLINCLVHIVTLLINHPDIHKYQYKGIVYRGLSMTQNDLKHYNTGNYILNRSFVSTSKNLAVAQIFADSSRQSLKVSVLLKYIIKQNQTAIDIEHIPTIQDGQEVLILPFSVFQVKNKIEHCPNMGSSILIEIDLEECEDNEQMYHEKEENKTHTVSQYSAKTRKNIPWYKKKRTRFGLGLLIILCLAGIVIGSIFGSRRSAIPNKTCKKKWSQNGVTVAGGNGAGSGLNQLNRPYGLFVDESGVIYVADSFNNRVIKWKVNASSGELVAGGRGRGNASDQLTEVADVIVDKNGTMYITDHQNRRVQQWFQGAYTGQTILKNLLANGIAQDDEGSLYVSEWTDTQVRKWRKGEAVGKVVLSGLKAAIRVFVDRHRTVYAADFSYHQIMKIAEGEAKGSMVAGGSEGSGDGQFRGPTGVLVDKSGNVYVTDTYNHRVMCWPPGAKAGTLIVGGHGIGSRFDQLDAPHDLAFDLDENLYVLDTYNHRVQKFVINKNLV